LFMPIRTRRQDKSLHGTQVTEAEGIIAILPGGSTACYKGVKPKSRVLCGSI
jgi:hypothetical protein